MNGINILTFGAPWTALKHGFTCRAGGVSAPPFDSLNLGFSRPEPRENILENYARLCKHAGLEYESLVLVNYHHGDNVTEVFGSDRGRGFTREPLALCDGIFTRSLGVTLVTLHADCLPVYVFDPATPAIGLAHAGWKGTLARIGQKLALAMAKAYGGNTARFACAIGPGICQDCFEVDASLGQTFAQPFPSAVKFTGADKAHIGLAACLEAQMRSAGIGDVQIMRECTSCNPHLFSHRRDNGLTGAMAAFLALPDSH